MLGPEGPHEDLVLSHGLRGEVIRKATVQMLPEDKTACGPHPRLGPSALLGDAGPFPCLGSAWARLGPLPGVEPGCPCPMAPLAPGW